MRLAKHCASSTAQQQHQAHQQGPDISHLHLLLQSQWDHAKNLQFGNILIKPFSHKTVWWRCSECPNGDTHEWQAVVRSRTIGLGRSSSNGCPYCAGKAVCPHNSLAVNCPAVAAQWSATNADKPEDYTAGSGAHKVWRCGACDQEWTAVIRTRTKLHTGCPHCYGQKRMTKRQKQPPVVENQHAMYHWDWAFSKAAGLDPHTLSSSSHKHIRWICHKCPRGQSHSWTTTVSSLCKGSGCPSCSGRKACVCNSLQSLHPDLAAEWDYSQNIGTPDDYSAQSNKKMWWRNNKRGSFEAYIHLRTQCRQKPNRSAS